MRLNIAFALAVPLALAACGGELAETEQVQEAAQSVPEVATVPPAELAELVAAGKVVLVDVRRPEEFAAGHLAGALNAPLGTFDPAAIPIDSSRETVLYCASSRRSGSAAKRLAEQLGTKIRHMEGGIQAWQEGGFAVVAEENPPS